MRRMADDLDRPAAVLLDPFLSRPGLALIRPDMLQMREQGSNAVEDERHRRAILCISGMYRRTQDASQHSYQHAARRVPALASGEFLCSIVASKASHTRPFDRLAVDDTRRRLRVPPVPRPHTLT